MGRKRKDVTEQKQPMEEPIEDITDVVDNVPLIDEDIEVIDTLYDLIFKNAPPMTDEKLRMAMALSTLRMVEVGKENLTEYAIYTAINDVKETIMKEIIKTVIKNNLRFIDSSVIMSSIMKDLAALSIWEYENIKIADGILGTPAI